MKNSLKEFQTLVTLEESPHMPHGYSLMIFMSFFPQVWFKGMDPVVDQYNKLKNGKIESAVMIEAMKETRKFIIEMALATTLLMVVSYAF